MEKPFELAYTELKKGCSYNGGDQASGGGHRAGKSREGI